MTLSLMFPLGRSAVHSRRVTDRLETWSDERKKRARKFLRTHFANLQARLVGLGGEYLGTRTDREGEFEVEIEIHPIFVHYTEIRVVPVRPGDGRNNDPIGGHPVFARLIRDKGIGWRPRATVHDVVLTFEPSISDCFNFMIVDTSTSIECNLIERYTHAVRILFAIRSEFRGFVRNISEYARLRHNKLAGIELSRSISNIIRNDMMFYLEKWSSGSIRSLDAVILWAKHYDRIAKKFLFDRRFVSFDPNFEFPKGNYMTVSRHFPQVTVPPLDWTQLEAYGQEADLFTSSVGGTTSHHLTNIDVVDRRPALAVPFDREGDGIGEGEAGAGAGDSIAVQVTGALMPHEVQDDAGLNILILSRDDQGGSKGTLSTRAMSCVFAWALGKDEFVSSRGGDPILA